MKSIAVFYFSFHSSFLMKRRAEQRLPETTAAPRPTSAPPTDHLCQWRWPNGIENKSISLKMWPPGSKIRYVFFSRINNCALHILHSMQRPKRCAHQCQLGHKCISSPYFEDAFLDKYAGHMISDKLILFVSFNSSVGNGLNAINYKANSWNFVN